MRSLVLVSALLLEAGSAAALWWNAPAWQRGLAFAVAQMLASTAMAAFVHRMLPLSLQESKVQGIAFLFILSVMVPVFGPAAMALGILAAFRWPRKVAAQSPWQEVESPALPYQPPQVTGKLGYGEGCFLAMLRHSSHVDHHLRSVMATRLLPEQSAILILTEALKSRVDDVRLLAYGFLDARQRRILGRIQSGTEELIRASPDRRTSICKQLAYDYWELVHLGLVRDEMLVDSLSKAVDFAQEALKGHPRNGCLTLLLGRMLLRAGKRNEAEAVFRHALALGLPAAVVNPWLAEVAFGNRDFAAVRECFSTIDPAQSPESVAAIAAFWR